MFFLGLVVLFAISSRGSRRWAIISSMKRIIVASENPVKLNATEQAFTKMWPDEEFVVQGVSVSSEVSDQPMTSQETYDGAFNRARNAESTEPKADYWVGLEGGIEDGDHGMEAFAWMVVRGAMGRIGKGRTGSFYLPEEVAGLVREGKELGEADDIVFKETNSKQAGGAVGLLTDGLIGRTDYYEQAMIFALIPHKNQDLYPADKLN